MRAQFYLDKALQILLLLKKESIKIKYTWFPEAVCSWASYSYF